MLRDTEQTAVVGATAYGHDGQRIATVEELLLDEETGTPGFVTLMIPRPGGQRCLVPVLSATLNIDSLLVPYDARWVLDSPAVTLDGGRLAGASERRLYDYYGLGFDYSTSGYSVTEFDSARS